jgi:adenosine 3'-phospho 5'-phosphosulfate transporter B2
MSAGLFAFLLTSTNQDDGDDKGKHGPHSQAATTLSGLIILIGYLVFDSFTSNWQSELYRAYQMSSLDMMAGVNLFSVLLTTTSLIQQGTFVAAADFASRHPQFVSHVIILSATSAIGQLFIFYTIAQFGAVTFTIIMTVRQGLAILLSCVVYQHPVSVVGMVGIVLVFIAIFARIYLSHAQRKTKACVHGSEPNAV